MTTGYVLWPLKQAAALLLACSLGSALAQAAVINTSFLGQNGWYSDDTRAVLAQDGFADNTNLIGITKTDLATGVPPTAGVAGHDAAIDTHIIFSDGVGILPPAAPPSGQHQGAVNLTIGNSAAGKSQISHISNTAFGGAGGHAAGSVLGPGAWFIDYSWLGDGTPTVTAGLKLGIKTSQFGSTGTSARTGENVWDKLLIYEPGNGNGGISDGDWHLENILFGQGKWWLFDRVSFTSNISNPLTLADWSTETSIFTGSQTYQDIFNLFTDPDARITSIQFGIGSGNANGNVYVNQLISTFYRPGDITTFGLAPTAQEVGPVIPEPSTLALLSLGLLFLKRRPRR